MLNSDFIKQIEPELGTNFVLELMHNCFLNFKENLDYNLEVYKNSLSIDIKNEYNKYLFIDLSNKSLEIRFDFSELLIFIDEVDCEIVAKLLNDFFKGNYILKTAVKNELIVSQEILFIDEDLSQFNRVDIYGNQKADEISQKRGYNWFN
ncbi:hypothetical protein NAT51_12885 [Flavobacterium amniphilum]|uniref:hypothetical protein n=1 Tax=Flavobacterium amniphilum TaxID=1834035 RepID=UPI002029C6C6|nr:hypothetical protein [Flavobacterium amniphilum]MCL9806425.1 hypothetical protein [Flavobacterium amniphilum]